MSRIGVRVLAAIAAVVAAALALPVWGAPLDDNEADQVRGVVATQLAALAAGDADRAFATASPSVRQTIGDPGRFMALVSGNWPMVRNAVQVRFQKPEVDEEDGGVTELVELVDEQSRTWIALFLVERQPDASWRISGCAVAENPWIPA